MLRCDLLSINRLTVFGLSAIDNSSSAVRRMGEKIVVKLYEIDPITVRRIMPPYNPNQVLYQGMKTLSDWGKLALHCC